MLDSQQKSTGTGYTSAGALLVAAFILSPVVLIVSRPFAYASVFLAIGCSAICVAFAWINWKKGSRLSIPSIAIQGGRTK